MPLCSEMPTLAPVFQGGLGSSRGIASFWEEILQECKTYIRALR